MDRHPSTVSGGTGRALRAFKSPSFFSAEAREATRISFSWARVMATYSSRISSDRISRLRRADTASRAAVG